MNKELTPLEPLEIIKHTTDLYMPNELNGYKEELDIIETELKRLGKIDVLLDKYGIKNNDMLESALIGFINDYTEEGRDIIGEQLTLLNAVKKYLIIQGTGDNEHLAFKNLSKKRNKKDYELIKEELL